MIHRRFHQILPAVAAGFLAACASTATSTAPPDLQDANKDGKLDRDEFRTGLVNSRFARLDINQDGRVGFDEWRAVDPTIQRPTFDSRDADHDGAVSLAEAHASARRLGTTDTLFHLLDTNGDGFIDEKEAADYARKAKGRNLP
jgi:Ca2+-binding EF-hand superfamily protein